MQPVANAAPLPVPSAAAWSRLRPLMGGLALLLAQVAFVALAHGPASLSDFSRSLSEWDSRWYADIALHGYHSNFPPSRQDPDEANVAFFPAFPASAWLVHRALGIDTRLSTVVAAQLACWGFWAYVLLFLRRWRSSSWLTFVTLATIAAQPAAFFLVVGYSESLFLCALLGFLYWSDETSRGSWLLAGLHGLVMTATRLVGIPLVIAPFLAPKTRWAPALAAAGLAAMGAVGFFAYCQLRFGHWDLYLTTQRVGWDVEADYLALFRPDCYAVGWEGSPLDLLRPNKLGQLSVSATMLLFLGVAGVEVWLARTVPDTGWRQRLGFYACAWLMFYISVSGLYHRQMVSMVRYAFCVHVLLLLALAHLAGRLRPLSVTPRRIAFAAWALLVALSLTVQWLYAHRFTHGGWVA